MLSIITSLQKEVHDHEYHYNYVMSLVDMQVVATTVVTTKSVVKMGIWFVLLCQICNIIIYL